MSDFKKLQRKYIGGEGFTFDELRKFLEHYGYWVRDDEAHADVVRFYHSVWRKSIVVYKRRDQDMVRRSILDDIAKTLVVADRGEEVHMYDVLIYKGYIGSIEVSLEDYCLYGKILGIRDLVLYEGNTLKELENDFHEMVDYYLETRG